jgi:hypothetical protein
MARYLRHAVNRSTRSLSRHIPTRLEDFGWVNSFGPVNGKQEPLSQVRASLGPIGVLTTG